MKLIPELIRIQAALKVPKNRRNNFGNYAYRNASDILEAAKPLLVQENCLLVMGDEIVSFGEHLFLKATVHFICKEDVIENSAYAMLDTAKKGMDGAQITGSASSYARKTALCGLFLIDDGIDPDSLPPQTEQPRPTAQPQTPAVPRQYTAPVPPPPPVRK